MQELDQTKIRVGKDFYFRKLLHNTTLFTKKRCYPHHHDHIQLTEADAGGGQGREEASGYLQHPG